MMTVYPIYFVTDGGGGGGGNANIETIRYVSITNNTNGALELFCTGSMYVDVPPSPYNISANQTVLTRGKTKNFAVADGTIILVLPMYTEIPSPFTRFGYLTPSSTNNKYELLYYDENGYTGIRGYNTNDEYVGGLGLKIIGDDSINISFVAPIS